MSPRRFHRGVTLFFALVVLALGLAAVVGAPLSFDGAFFLFRVLDKHQFAADHGRLINIALQLPVLMATRYTDNLAVLRAAFSIAYAAIPLVGLVVSWMVCKSRRPSLFIWPAISICIASLPGQFSFHSEAIIAVTLLWPAMLAVLLGGSSVVLALIAITSVAAAASHPSASMILVLIVAVAIGSAITRPKARRVSIGFAFAMGGLLLARSLTRLDPYEGQALGAQTVISSFNNSVLGWPLVAVSFAIIAAISCLLPQRRHARTYLILPLVLAGAALVAWASSPANWAGCLDYRYWVAPVSLPFMAGATVEAFWLRGSPELALEEMRTYALLVIGTIFFLVLSIQSIQWAVTTRRLVDDLVSSDAGCVSRKTVESIRGSAVDNWPVTVYAIEMQSRKPRTLLLPNGLACELFALNGDALLVDLTTFKVVRRHSDGWFDFEEARLRVEKSGK